MKNKSSARDHMKEGAFHFALNQFEESVEHFSNAIEADPKHHMAFLSRGVAYAKMDRPDLAKADFDRAIELNPHDPRGYHFRGLTHLSRGNRGAAKSDFDKAIELNPRYGVAYFSRGTTLSEMGDADTAGRDMVMAARLGEANLQEFSDYYNIWRTQFDKTEAVLLKEREADIAVKPDLTSWLED
ncbi:MAG: tetratricopeptide repeat protein [bacterium]